MDGEGSGSARQSAHLDTSQHHARATRSPARLKAPKHLKSASPEGAVTCSPAGRRCPQHPVLIQCTQIGHLYYLGKCYSLANVTLYIKFQTSSNTEANQGDKSLWRAAQWPCSASSHYFLHSIPSPKQTIFLCIPKMLQGCFPAPTRRGSCCHQSPSQLDSYRASLPPLPASS